MSTARLYTGPAGRLLADTLASNLTPPARVYPTQELPAPDPHRTQRLRTERAELARALAQDRRLLALAAGQAGRFPQEVADIRADVRRYEQRLAEIELALASAGQKGGPADA
ncbi:hypothetical protein [Hymenobacter perfusus]|uniref:Uncharacterized protein n=1 Tax=Hymenobacter perfusus TaxID=1236770 RepID=A0A428KDZ9_9BACT|nr:hypothetical protein [Hymenobacter perfusus]RSK44687.1 hypothetical protein EI293_09255 [Hymenobacter perfusus]